MVQVHWKVVECPQRIKYCINHALKRFRIIYMSLCYNHFTTWNTILETALEPMFWIVDHSTRYLGIVSTLVLLVFTHLRNPTKVTFSHFELYSATTF